MLWGLLIIYKMSNSNSNNKRLSGERKLERLERCVSNILNKYGNSTICLEKCSFEAVEKLAMLLDSEELIKKRLCIEKNETLRLRMMEMLLEISVNRPQYYGYLTKERVLNLTTGHDGYRLLHKGALRRVLRKWFPAVFNKNITDYNSSIIDLLGFPSTKEIVIQNQKQIYTEGTAFVFLIVGVFLGFLIGRS